MSRPTIRFRTFFLSTWFGILCVVCDAGRRVPTDRETVAVAQVDVAHVRAARRDHGAGDRDEALESRRTVLPAEAYACVVVADSELPRAACIELDLRQPHADSEQPRISFQIQLRDLRLGARWPDQLRQLRRNVSRMRQEQFAARVH